MTQYKSFKNTKNKLEKIWNRVEDNTSRLKNVPVVNLNYNSINFNKRIITIPIIANTQDYVLTTILLKNFPENMINMSHLTIDEEYIKYAVK